MGLFEYIIFVLFGIALFFGWKDSQNNRKTIDSLQQQVYNLTAELEEKNKTITKYQNTNYRYINELENFRKILEEFGIEQGLEEYTKIPYCKKVESSIGDSYLGTQLEIKTDYIIPSIHICYTDCWNWRDKE